MRELAEAKMIERDKTPKHQEKLMHMNELFALLHYTDLIRCFLPRSKEFMVGRTSGPFYQSLRRHFLLRLSFALCAGTLDDDPLG